MTRVGEEITQYFRSVLAANTGVDFKKETFFIIDPEDLMQGQIDADVSDKVFASEKKGASESRSNNNLDVLICAKTVKTSFEGAVKSNHDIEELTGLYYIPATLHQGGKLVYNNSDKKLPWFPREYLLPMVEPIMSIGNADDVDQFISDHVDQIELLKHWPDYVEFFKKFYEYVTKGEFEQHEIPSRDSQESTIELEQCVYLFIDNTVRSTFNIMKLYNHLLEDSQHKPLYKRFLSKEPTELIPLVPNNLSSMNLHSGQMGGEYPLSPSQREAVNHFNQMKDGEILAVNGPPGTGKTTLLQSIVADLFVKRALEKGEAPLIVATSTNNQAVTNIISSFGKIKNVRKSNLEERWIEGVNSFATYFPSTQKINEARNKEYQYTNSKGEYFVANIETKENMEASIAKLVKSCNEFFGTGYVKLSDCQEKLHKELTFFEKTKLALLHLGNEADGFENQGKPIDDYLNSLEEEIKQVQESMEYIQLRVKEWNACYKRVPFFLRWSSKRVQTDFRLFMNQEELNFLQDTMKFKEIKEVYSHRYADFNRKLSDLNKKQIEVREWMGRYDDELKKLSNHSVELHNKDSNRYDVTSERINELLDTTIRYIEFWLAVHYFECRWASGEDALTEKQVGTSFKNVLEKFYNRLAMITPCLVMTFFMLPKQFLAYGDQKNFYLYNYIDLLIVDEAGQVSPEIAAGAFSLAKKAIVVGDIYQIEPVWAINKALDKALAQSSKAIKEIREYEQLELSGLQGYGSSVMRVASKSCKYQKYEERGLFLSEHRRCYDEIIDYCNRLVYKGRLEPMRGTGKGDTGRVLNTWPQMGYRQIISEYSSRQGASRYNRNEASQIAEWLRDHFSIIQAAYPKESEENLVGVITPFKAQVSSILAEIKIRIPHLYNKISVGTVHTFQGAERNVILFSTVYGKSDGCFFIDANKSLMNVAVSRAKDHFFVFGDLDCMKDTLSSSSGLLRSIVKDNPL